MLRGWVNYFAVGHSSECFSFIKDWVEKKVRRHLAHAQKRKGFGWERWNRRWLYDTLGCSTPTECDATDRKLPQQDRPHKRWREANGGAQCGKSACCVRRGGDWRRGMVEIVGHSQTKGRDNREPKLRPKPARQSSTLLMSGDGKRGVGHRPQATAPILDSTRPCENVGEPGTRRIVFSLGFFRQRVSARLVLKSTKSR